MSYCSHCGKQIEDGALVCTQCGFAVKTENTKPVKTHGALKFFMVLGCILNAFYLLIPLCWCIPMTVVLFKKIKKGEKIGMGFKVCTLLFISTIAGILILCDRDI